MTTSRKSWRGPSILLILLLFRPGSFSSNVHQHRVLRTRLGEAARRRHHKLHSTFVRHDLLLPARRYASAGTSHDPVSVSVSVYLFVTSRRSIKRDERINLVLARGFFRPVLYTVLRTFRYLQKLGYFPLDLYPKLRN